jgi:hypothetical protein
MLPLISVRELLIVLILFYTEDKLVNPGIVKSTLFTPVPST